MLPFTITADFNIIRSRPKVQDAEQTRINNPPLSYNAKGGLFLYGLNTSFAIIH